MLQKSFFSSRRAIYWISVFCFLFPLSVVSLRAGWSGLPAALSAGLLAGGTVLLLMPVAEERFALSCWVSLGVAAVCCVGSLLVVPERVWLGVVLLLHLTYLTVRTRDRFVQLRPLFRHIAVWHNVENCSRWYCSTLLYLLVCLFPTASAPAWTVWSHPTGAFAFYLFLWTRVRTGRTALLTAARESEIKELIRGNLRTAPPQAGVKTEEVAKMSRVYERVVSLMENKHAFLDAKYNLADMASSVYTNKTYLSKTINIFSGRNFSQFVNYYRIRYCVDLLRRDPHLRLTSAAMMSGFHSTVTFNMAFKLNMGETPSSFKERLLMERQN